MKIFKFFQYAYLIFASLFVYDAISNWNADGYRPYASLGLAALAVFMFFFRRKFNKRFEENNHSQKWA